MSPTIVSVLGFKGGIAKTTTVVNLGASLAKHHGKNILLIDLDPQANLTHHLLGHELDDELGISDAILNEQLTIEDVVKPTSIPSVSVVPSTASMDEFEGLIFPRRGRELWLKKLFNRSNLEKYSYIFLDNAPAKNNACYNSLCASNFYLMPIYDYGSLEGIMDLKSIVDECIVFNPALKSIGILKTIVDKREGISGNISDLLIENFEAEVFEAHIRRNVRFKECPSSNQSIFDIEKEDGRGYNDYMKATSEFVERVALWQ